MTLEQLRIFAAVAEREHVTRAAAALHLTQAAVSAAIAALERTHDIRLFDRVGRGVALTEAGRQFLPQARAVLARAGEAETAIADLSGLKRGRLAVHASQTMASYFLPSCLVAFRARYPGLEVALAIGNTAEVAQALREGRAELGFVEGEPDAPELVLDQVAEERMGIFVAASHPFAQGRPLSAEDLHGTAWVFREEGSGTRSAFLAALRAMGIAPPALNVALTLPSNEAVREAVVAGAGAACLSPMVCNRSVQAGVMAQARFAMPPRPFYAARHAERYVTRAAAAFLMAVKLRER